MKTRALFFLLGIASFSSCDFSKSVNKDLITGLLTKGDGLSCEEVVISVNEKAILRTSFEYGEEFVLYFRHVEGFERLDDFVFPGMSMRVVSKSGDTVLFNGDVYADLPDGTDQSPLTLNAGLLVADPIHSNETYTLYADIWDKQGDGVFQAKLNFEVEPNILIQVESQNISYQEVYLYSEDRSQIITNNAASFDETIHLVIEGLEGFIGEGDKVFPGMSLSIEDAEGNSIIQEEDLFAGADLLYADVHDRLSASFYLSGSEIHNPIYCDLLIWDKRGEGSLKASTQIQIEN